MNHILSVYKNGVVHTFTVPVDFGYYRFFVDGKVCIDFYFKHCHAYGFAVYLFEDRLIYSLRYFRTKKEMIGAIQYLLQEYVNK